MASSGFSLPAWDVTTASRPTALQLLLAEHGGQRRPISLADAFRKQGGGGGGRLHTTMKAVSFWSIANTRFGRVPRLNEVRQRARRCFLAVFFLCALRRNVRREGVVGLRVADRVEVDATAKIHLPDGVHCRGLPEETLARFRSLAVHRLQLIFLPILLRRAQHRHLAHIYQTVYRDAYPSPSAEDLRLSSPFFARFPAAALEELAARGTRRVYTRGMWVGAPRSARSARRGTINRGSAESKLGRLLPQLCSSGVLPPTTPALYSAFLVLHGSVVDLSSKASAPTTATATAAGAALHHVAECGIKECFGEVCAFAEGGVDGRGFKVQSHTALVWEIDVLAIAEVIASLRWQPAVSAAAMSSAAAAAAPAAAGSVMQTASAALMMAQSMSASVLHRAASSHHHGHNHQHHHQSAYDSVLDYIIERRIAIMTTHFRPEISQVQQWSLFRGCTTAVDVTTHVLPKLVPRVFMAGTTIVGPDSGEADRGVYFVARGCVTATGNAAVERAPQIEWQSFGDYEAYFNEGFDISFHASTVVDVWLLPRPVMQSISKIPYLRADMISLGLQLREAFLRRCGPVRDVVDHALHHFSGERRLYYSEQLVQTVVAALSPKVFPAGERVITAGEDEKTCIFFVRGKLNQSSAHGFIAHSPPHLYAPAALLSMLDPEQCARVGPVVSSWKLSLVAVRNCECWVAPVAKMHQALKAFFENCDLPPSALVRKTPFPSAAGSGVSPLRHTSSSVSLLDRRVSSHHLLRAASAAARENNNSTGSGVNNVSFADLFTQAPPTGATPVAAALQHRDRGGAKAPAAQASTAASTARPPSASVGKAQHQQQQQPARHARPAATALESSVAAVMSASFASASGSMRPGAAPHPPRFVRGSDGRQYRGPPHLGTAGRGLERVRAMREHFEAEVQAAMQGPAINSDWCVEDMPVPPRTTARRMHDLECIGELPSAPDKRVLLLLRRLPQTPRVHGKLPAEFATARYVRQQGKSSLGAEGQQQRRVTSARATAEAEAVGSGSPSPGGARGGGAGGSRGGGRAAAGDPRSNDDERSGLHFVAVDHILAHAAGAANNASVERSGGSAVFLPHNQQQQQQQLESSRTMAALESIVSRQRNFCSLAKAARGNLKTELAVATRMLHQSGQRGNGLSAAVGAAAVAAEEQVAEALDESDGENEAA